MSLNKKPNKTSKTNSQKHNKTKGKLLEQIVATLYQTPGAEIQTNVDYPTKDGKSTREIDILWTTNLGGLIVEYAFQCKNEVIPIGVGKLSQFFGDLDDIGIPPRYGIFVSVNGFTEDAQRYAATKGIKTLVLKGLTQDRLKSEVSSAIQHNVFLVPRIEEMSILNAAPDAEHDYQFVMFLDEDRRLVGTILDLIFNKWRNGEISEELCEHSIELMVPINWFQFYKDEHLAPMKVSAKLSVLAVVITIDGTAENHFLLDAETKKLEKSKTQVKFQGFKEGDEIPLTVISSEKELREFFEKSNATRLTIKSRLPRIISNKSYYPLSKPVADKIFNQIKKYALCPEELSQQEFDEILFEASQNDLFREGIYNFFGRSVSVIVTNDEGDLIDLNLFAEKGDFDKVISLKDRYIENPSDSFGSMLAWAYEEKSCQLLLKAKESRLNQIDLLKKSLENLEISLKLNSESISALEQRTEILFALEDYKEALKTNEFILTKKHTDINTHLIRISILIKLEEWDSALKEVEDTEKLLKISNGDIEYAEFNIKIYRAEILHGKNKNKQAWSNILEAWESFPESTVSYFGGRNSTDAIVRAVLTVESRWFHIELLYFRATKFLQIHEYHTANEIVNFAVLLLNGIKLIDQMEEEPIAIGEIKGSFLRGILERIAKLLNDTGNKAFAEEQINKISDWFERTYKEEPTFLKS